MDDAATKSYDDSKAMPPPPLPILLEQEMESLRRCLQNAMLKIGQILSFYNDTRRLELTNYTDNHAPRALTSSMGRELERFDQLCDVVGGHLLRAIAVLQRDLLREENKEAARFRIEAQKNANVTAQKTQSAGNFQFAEPAPPSSESHPTNPQNSPINAGGGSLNARRPSGISISSLHRPQVPLKLDLTSSTLRLTSEEGSGLYTSGLSSPVTLAPKSARPIETNEFSEQFVAYTVDGSVIDLTQGNDRHLDAGDSSDKPIELDLDMDMNVSMDDLFGDNPNTSGNSNSGVGNMFAISDHGPGPGSKRPKDSTFIDLTEHEILASLSNNAMDTNHDSDPMTVVETSSPTSLLATNFPQHIHTSHALDGGTGLGGSDQPFDMTGLGGLGDLGSFHPPPDFSLPETEINAFLNIGASTGGDGNDSNDKSSAST